MRGFIVSMRSSWWIVVILTVACGGADTGERAGGDDVPRRAESTRATSGPTAPSDARSSSTEADHPGSPQEVVVALIEAFQAGDRARVEALWARDGGTWTDDAGFRERAAYFQAAEFDLDPGSIVTDTSQGTPMVIVTARQNGRDFAWRFLIAEIDGRLRAGGVETYPVGMP